MNKDELEERLRDYFHQIELAKEDLSEDRFAQEYLADFRKTEGLVYKEFNDAIHLLSPFHIPAFDSIRVLGEVW
jgi:hypothetical protein